MRHERISARQSEAYQERRDVLVSRLEQIGWCQVTPPRAGMFLWAPIPEKYRLGGSMEFAMQMMEEAEVAMAPGPRLP